MAHTFEHTPVLRDEVVSLFASVPAGVVIDATLGGGGHAAALLAAYPALRVVGLDRDQVALQTAQVQLSSFGDRIALIRSPFSGLAAIISSEDLGTVSGVLFDLGVSSPQLDQADRGFSFRNDGPLDMRMDQQAGPTAADLVNTLPEDQLAALFRENGEGRLSGRIARAVVPRAAPVQHRAAGRRRRVGRSRCRAPQGSSRRAACSRRCASRSTTSSASCEQPCRSHWTPWRSAACAR